jgi:DNA repair exonuclease SbcCD nuclease subunit
MKILHSADWHVRDKDIEEITKCLGFLVETARTEGTDLITIAGDCFDSRDIKLDSQSAKLVIKIISELADICPVAVVLGRQAMMGPRRKY